MPTIKYDLEITGMRNVEQALAGVEKRIRDFNRKVAATTGAQQTSSDSAKAAAAARREENEAKKAAARIANEEIKAKQRSEREKTRIVERESRERARVEKQWDDYNRRLKDQHNRELFRNEDRARKEAIRRRNYEEAADRRSRAEWVGSTRGVIAGTGRTLAAVGRSALAFSGLAGGALFANAAHSYMATSAAATSLSNQMAKAGESKESIIARKAGLITNAQKVEGFDTKTLLEAQRAFGGKSGDYALGGKLLKQMAQVSQATGVDLSEVMQVGANAHMKLAPTMSGKELEQTVMDVVRTFAGQGNVGSVEIKDLAMYAGRITASSAMYAGPRQKNMALLGAMAQTAIGAGAASDAAEATTTVERFANDLTRNSDKAQAMGIQVFTDPGKGKGKNTTFRQADQLIADIMEKTGGSTVMLKKMFGLESIKMIQGYAQLWKAGEAGGKGGGRKAIEAEFSKFTGAALSEKDVRIRSEAALSDETARIEENFKRLNDTIGSKLAPIVANLADKLGNAAPQLERLSEGAAKAAVSLAENPLKGVGVIVAAAVTKEIATAGIGAGIKGALSSAVLLAGPTVATAIGGALAAVIVGAGAAWGIMEATDDTKDSNKLLTSVQSDVTNQMQEIENDKRLSPKQKYEKKLALLEGAERSVSDIMENRSFSSKWGGGGVGEAKGIREDIAKEKQDALLAYIAQKDAAAKLSEAADKLKSLGLSNRNDDPIASFDPNF